MSNKLHLARLAIVITTRCNLKCKLCSVGIPTQREHYHMELNDFNSAVDRIFEVVDRVDSLEFAGGEPLLHSNLPHMIEKYMEYKNRFKQWLLVTNGTVQIGKDLMAVLSEHKQYGVFHISDYNIYPEKTNTLIETLDKIGFKYRVDKYHGDGQYQGGWVDPGLIEPRNRSKEALTDVFSNCGLVKNGGCWRLYKGKIHLCTRSCRCIDEGLDFPDDYLDLFDTRTDDAEKADKLRTILSGPYLEACDYCNGDLGTIDKSKRFPAAEQA